MILEISIIVAYLLHIFFMNYRLGNDLSMFIIYLVDGVMFLQAIFSNILAYIVCKFLNLHTESKRSVVTILSASIFLAVNSFIMIKIKGENQWISINISALILFYSEIINVVIKIINNFYRGK